MSTTERLIRLVDQGKVQKQTCAARVLGVSHQRVNQIVKAKGLKLGKKYSPDVLLSWPCPNCGEDVKRWSSLLSAYRTAYCPTCARRLGERRKPDPSKHMTLTCPDCGKQREIRKIQWAPGQSAIPGRFKTKYCKACACKRFKEIRRRRVDRAVAGKREGRK